MDLEVMHHIITLSLPLFLIMDPIGNAAMCIGMLKDYTPRRQRRILLRELLIALAIILLFQFVGEGLLELLDIRQSTLRVAGGILLFIISLKMVFPPAESGGEEQEKDPFIVPIAIPFVAGPSLLAAVMLYSHREPQSLVLSGSIVVAWLASTAIMLSAPSLTRILGKRGLRAAERLMGMILIFLSIQMLEDGIRLFIDSVA